LLSGFGIHFFHEFQVMGSADGLGGGGHKKASVRFVKRIKS
jgi:hypothetical protein